MDEYDQLRERILRCPDAKFGFVVYRCTYKDNANWDKFMEYLNAHTRWKLEGYGIGDLYSRLDWAVQQDPTLEDASEEEVRKRFRKWIEDEHEISHATPRHRACVMVSDLDVDWAINKHPLPPDEHQSPEILTVTLISKWDEDPESDEEEEFDSFDPNKPLEEQMYADSDDDDSRPHPPRDKVSSTRVGLSYLLPGTWSLLDGPGWHSVVNECRAIHDWHEDLYNGARKQHEMDAQ